MNEMDSLRVLGPALPPVWLRYRDAFAVLQYLCTLAAGEPKLGVPWQKVVTDLGFTECQGDEMLAYLLAAHCVEYHQGVREAALMRKALEYLDWKRGRRRSVRPELAFAAAAGG